MKTYSAVVLSLLLVLLGCAPQKAMILPMPPPAPSGPLARVAVVAIEARANGEGALADLAGLAQDICTEKMQNAGAFVVIERERLGQVLKEQGLGGFGVVDERTAARVGRVLGVQAIVVGRVTVERAESVVNVFLFRRKVVTRQTRVSLRLIDTNTGEIWYADSAEGAASQSSLSLVFSSNSRYETEKQDESLTRKAITSAMGALVAKIASKAAAKPWSGTVLGIDDGQIVISAGAAINLPVGALLSVYRPGKMIPGYGRLRGARVGTLRLVEHQGPQLSRCERQGKFAIRKDDHVEYQRAATVLASNTAVPPG